MKTQFMTLGFLKKAINGKCGREGVKNGLLKFEFTTSRDFYEGCNFVELWSQRQKKLINSP